MSLDVLVDPHLFNIHDDELAQNAEAVWLLNNLNESPDRSVDTYLVTTGGGGDSCWIVSVPISV